MSTKTLFDQWQDAFSALLKETRATMHYSRQVCFGEAVEMAREHLVNSDLAKREAELYLQLGGRERALADEQHGWAAYDGDLPRLVA